jgi:hypothetical protein
MGITNAWTRIVLLAGFIGGSWAWPAAGQIALEPVATGLAQVTAIAHAGDGSGRLFVVLKAGRIVIRDDGGVRPTPFLNISTLVSTSGERGLLGLAFHPRYPESGFFYVFYTDVAGNLAIARYARSADPNVANPASGVVLVSIPHPGFDNHNGGQLKFGPDGYLYIATGDGGGGGDPGNNAQNRNRLLGKLLRIDVDGGFPYAIPLANPFATGGGAPAVWAYGLRNPFRFSFDRLTGDLFIGDVGENNWEEINFQPAGSPGGQNYGWRRMEGNHCLNPSSNCNDGTLVFPIIEYSHGNGCSVIGGYRYRGLSSDALLGSYFYGDFCSGRIWIANRNPGGSWTTVEALDTPHAISTFGEDETGELYVAAFGANGAVYRIHGPAALRGIGVYRATTGEWFLRGTDGAPTVVRWGAPQLGDIAVAADYDGDGQADIAVFRPGSGQWFIRHSSAGTVVVVAWGSAAHGDVPVPADYDGDGRADIAVFRRATGEWFILRLGRGLPRHPGARRLRRRRQGRRGSLPGVDRPVVPASIRWR